MNDKLQQLYDLYKQKGIISTTDFNTFASASEDQRQKLYDLGVQKGLFNTTDFNTFNNAWGGYKQEPLKKKESTELASKSEKPTSGSSSRRFEGVTEEPISQKKFRTEDYIDQVQNANKKQTETKVANPFAQKPTEKTVDVLTTKEANKMMAEDFGKKEFAAYSSINKMPSTNALNDLDDETTADILNKQFEGTNLEFKKIGSQLTVTSKLVDDIIGSSKILNEKTIDLSEPDADKELKSFISTNILKKSEREQFENIQSVEELVKLVGSNPNKFSASLLEDMDVDSYFEEQGNLLSDEMARAKADTYDSDLKSYEQKVIKFNQDVKSGKMTKADFDARSAELNNERNSLENRRNIISNVIYKSEKIDKLLSNLEEANVITAEEKEKQGSRIGLFLRGSGEGVTDVSQALIDFGIAGAAAVMDAKTLADIIKPGEYERLKNLGFSDDKIKNEIQKSVKNRANKFLKSVPDAFSMGTTEEYAKSADRGIIDQAIYAIGESLGAVGGGIAIAPLFGTTAGFFAMSYNALEDQMRGPQFDALSENEKKIMSVPYGLVIGALERLGARVALGATTNKTLGMFSEYIIAKTFSSIPKDASLLEIKSAINKSVAASVANGMLKITGAGVVEGGTEFTQQIFEGIEKDVANRIIQSNQLETAKEEGGGTVSKEIYNQIVQNKFFKNAADLSTTEGIGQLLKESGNAFLVGAVAGGMTGTASVGVIGPISNKVSNNRFAVYRDIILNDDAREGAISSINKKVENNELTREQADEQIASINEAYPALRQIPTDFSVGAQREAFGLLMERERLNQEIKDKDPNLVAKQKERVAEINEQLKGISYAVQEQATGEVSVQPTTGVGTEMEEGVSETKPEGVTGETITEEVKVEEPKAEQPQANLTKEEIEARRKETEAKIKNEKLFRNVGNFSLTEGGSNKAAVPFSHREKNGIEVVEYAHPDTGSIDLIITGTSNNDFVGFYRLYENGKPTNRWSSKIQNKSRNKENFKTMIGSVQELLPAGHEYTEKENISTDGLRIWNQQLDRGYELQYDENGNLVTNEVAINGEAIVNELGIDVERGRFSNINVRSQAEFEKVKQALLPYLQKFGLNESNIRWMSGPLKDSGTVKIDLPVLKKSTSQETGQPAAQTEVTQAEVVQSEENQALIDAYVQEQTNLINQLLANVSQEERQEVLDELTSDPIAFAEKSDSELSSNFLNSLQRQPATEETAVAEKLTVNPSEGYSFEYESENDIPAELKGVEPTGRTETKVGRGKNAKTKLKLTFTGQQLIDAGLAVTPEAQAEVVQPEVQAEVQAEPTAKIESIEVEEVPQVEQSLNDLTQQNNVLTENDFTAARIRNVGKEKVVAQIQKAAKAIAKVLPKVKIVVHATPEAFVEATKDMDGRLSEGGLYDHQTGQIHINLEIANNRTVAHEVFHALILSRVNSDIEAQRLTRSMIKSVLKSIKKAEGTTELISYLEEFESNYDENIKNEEKLAELFGILADNYKALPPASKNIIVRFLNRLAKAFGLKEMTDREAIQFMNTLSRKVETGQEIEAREVGKQKEGKAAVRKQIIGEVGAKRLDQQENSTLRMDNLQVAKNMKFAGETPKQIRNATGWEMGAEGKWRYETVDNLPFFNDVVNKVKSFRDQYLNEFPLVVLTDRAIVSKKASEIIPSELINMYPELNDYTINFGVKDENEGSISVGKKTIRVNIGPNPINTVKVLLHEVQHAIQEIEGFDSGTNLEKILNQFIAQDNALKNRINKIRNTSPDSPLLDAVINKRKAFIDNFSTLNKNNEKVLSAFDLYMRKAGEIEANNVINRMNMTEEERRNTLLTETESVKDRQIIEDRATGKFAVRKQKTTGPSRIVENGIKAGKTDAEIRQEGRAAGFTNKEMTEALSKYYIKEQGIFMKSGIKGKVGQFVDFAKKWKQKYLTSKGLLAKVGFTYKEKMEGEISAEANRAAKTAKKFGVLFDKFTGDKELLKDAFDKVLRGDKAIQLPAGFAALANEMRNHIDRLSEMLIATGAVDADMADTIRKNIGSYITRSYEIYDNKNFRQKVGEQELQAAKNFLRTQPGMLELAKAEAARTDVTVDEALDALVDNKIDEYFADAKTGALVKGSRLGSKDLSTLKERKEIPEQIRMLMGEYSDPAMNYARTVLNIATLAARHQFLTQVKEAGMGKFFFDKNDSQKPKGFDTEIVSEGSETMSPLNGLRTTPEIAEAFGLYDGQKGKDTWIQQAFKTYYKAMGMVKWLKTIASFGTHMKNIFGNFGFVGLNGHSLIEIGKAANIVLQDLKTMSKPEIEARIDEYIKAGIMRQGAGINEIKDMFKDADMDDFLERRLSMRKPKSVMGKIKQVISSKSSRLKTAMEDLYQAEDDMFKIAAYETEMNRYADALYNKSKDQLTDKERQKVSEIAANNVKNTYPTYSRIPEGIKQLRKFPLFIGSFISFQAESYRTAYNTIGLAKDELSSDNKKIRKIGARRVAGASAYLTAKTALLSYAGYAAGTGIGGVLGALFDDDDEKKKEKDVRSFLPPWSQNSDIIILKAADGEIEYIDFSASDPHGGINKALNALFRGEDMVDSFKQSMLELVGQFQGPDILTNLAFQLNNNENDFGKPIYNEEDDTANKIDKIIDYVYKVVEPGTVTSIRKAIGSEQSAGQLAFGEATGLKIRKVDVKDQFGYKLPEFDESFKDIRKIYNSEYYKSVDLSEDPKATEKDIEEQNKKTEDALIRANKKYAAKAKELMDLINSANKFGVDYDDLINELSFIKSTMGKSNINEMENGGDEFIKEKDY